MFSSANPLTSLLALWFLIQIGSSVISSLAMLYVLFCLGKTAASMDRLASAVETLAERQSAPASLPQSTSFSPPQGTYPPGNPGPNAPYGTPYPSPLSGQPVPFSPGAPASQGNPTTPNTPDTNTPATENSGSNVPYIPRREVMP